MFATCPKAKMPPVVDTFGVSLLWSAALCPTHPVIPPPISGPRATGATQEIDNVLFPAALQAEARSPRFTNLRAPGLLGTANF